MPTLIGTNSDEGALFIRGGVTSAVFETQIRGGYGERADQILAANPHASHADELPYVFGTLSGPGRPAPRREDTAMSALVMAYWTNLRRPATRTAPAYRSGRRLRRRTSG